MSEPAALQDTASMPALNRKRLARMKSLDVAHFSVATSRVEDGKDVSAKRVERKSFHRRLSRTDSSVIVVVGEGPRETMRIETDFADPVIPNTVMPSYRDSRQGQSTTKPVFSHIVRKHFNSRRPSAASHNHSSDITPQTTSSTKPTISSQSCPNLAKNLGRGREPMKQRVRYTRSSEGVLEAQETHLSRTSKQRSSQVTSPSLLTVPDIFTTSFTHSPRCSPDQGTLPMSGPRYRHSAPELAADGIDDLEEAPPDKVNLTKSLSDTPPYMTFSRRRDVFYARSRHMSVDVEESQPPRMSALTSYLFVGNVEAAYCERVLCKQRIGSILDLSGMDPDVVPAHRKNPIPCTCGLEGRHPRAVLRLSLDQLNQDELESSLQQINKFIEGARVAGKNVMIFSERGTGYSELVAMQYLMRHRCINLRKAYSLLMRHRPDMMISAAHRELLQRLELEHIPAQEQSLCFVRPATDPASLLPMQAWSCTESSDI